MYDIVNVERLRQIVIRATITGDLIDILGHRVALSNPTLVDDLPAEVRAFKATRREACPRGPCDGQSAFLQPCTPGPEASRPGKVR